MANEQSTPVVQPTPTPTTPDPASKAPANAGTGQRTAGQADPKTGPSNGAATGAEEKPKRKRNKTKREIAREAAYLDHEAMMKVAYKAITGKEWTPAVDKMPPAELDGILYFYRIQRFLDKTPHNFVRDDETEELSLVIWGERMKLAFNKADPLQAKFMLNACGVSTVTAGAQAAFQRLRTHAYDNAPRLAIRRFSAISKDGQRLYIPVAGDKVLKITHDHLWMETNGENEDRYWVEYPPAPRTSFECEGPFKFNASDPAKEGLQEFERLLIQTQSTNEVSAWLVAMHSALFTFVRERVSTRALVELRGPQQHGKTSAAERFSLLLGRGMVYGSITPAFIGNEGDQGLLVLDNKEQANLNEQLIEALLLLATGATRGRSSQDGLSVKRLTARPVTLITSIEGIGVRGEMSARLVSLSYRLKPGMPHVDRDTNYREISQSRDKIMGALVFVLQEWLGLRDATFWDNRERPQLTGYFNILCQLLTAYERVAKKPEGWAKSIYSQWPALGLEQSQDTEEDMEWPIFEFLTRSGLTTSLDGPLTAGVTMLTGKLNEEGMPGTVYVTEIAPILSYLKRSNPIQWGKLHANGLGARLAASKFHRFSYLGTQEKGDPYYDSIPQLRRQGGRRPKGFFIPTAKEPDEVFEAIVREAQLGGEGSKKMQ